MYNLAEADRSIKKPLPIAELRTGEASNGHSKDRTWLFHGPWHDHVDEHICAEPIDVEQTPFPSVFSRVSLIFQRHKSDANKQDFEIK